MCKNIVGTEEHVKTLRMLNNVRDNLTSQWVLITSGSFGEGLVMRGSDVDLMKVSKEVEICEYTNIYFKPNTTYLKIKTENTQPGFTQLLLVHSDVPNILNLCVEVDGEYYFSNKKFKYAMSSPGLNIIHGPCLTDPKGLWDLAFCFHCKSWITQCKQWITRSHNSWPGYDVKETIIKHGVLCVPVGVKGSTNEESEWRISFSVGEKMLVYTFRHTQLLCYALMKILIKDVIATDLDCTDLLCSYFLKTILFWISEELPPSQWVEETFITCYMKCFRRLIYCVEYSVCPHYFIPENNLFENKIKGQVREILLKKLHFLNSYGWQCVLFSDQLSDINNVSYSMQREPNNSNIDNINRFLFSNIYRIDSCPIPSLKEENEIHRILSIESTKIKYLYMYCLSQMFSSNAQVLPFPNISDNKYIYKLYNTCISTLLRSIFHNAVSGWLLLASFIYKTKQYKKALDILWYTLWKCTPDKIYRFRNLSKNHHKLLNLNILRNMPISQLFKCLRLERVIFRKTSMLIPDEIQLGGPTSIPPVVFGHFLCFLCYYHLSDTKQCQNSLRYLKWTIEQTYFIAHVEKADSYNILGLALQLNGDLNSARQAFIQSIELRPEPNTNSAYRRLSLII